MLETTVQRISDLANQVATMLESGDTSAWTKPWKSTGSIPTNALTKAPYHGINQLSLWLEAQIKDYQTHWWMTFKQKNKLAEQIEQDISVRKGEHGSVCFRWVTWIPKQFKKTGDGFYINTRTGEQVTENQATQFTLKTFRVFNIDQMDGIPDSFYQKQKELMSFRQQQEKFHNFIETVGAEIKVGGDRAAYSPVKDRILMPPPGSFMTDDDYWSTMFHELVHWTGHKKRLDRPDFSSWGDNTYAKEELVAEFGSAFLCAEFDIFEPTLQHAEYLSHWASQLREEPDILLIASRGAEKAVAYLNKLAQEQVEELEAN